MLTRSEPSFAFVPFQPPEASHRQRELTKSLARSHARRISHARQQVAQHTGEFLTIGCPIWGSNATTACSCNDRTVKRPKSSLQVWNGNSDPFSSQAVAVTPRVNHVIRFYSDNMIPILTEESDSIYATLSRYTNLKPIIVDIVHKSGMLQEECFINTFQFAMLALMNRVGGALEQEALVLQGESAKCLRERLAQEHPTSSTHLPLFISILHLLKAAVYAGDEEGIVIHGTALRQAAFRDKEKGFIAIAFFTHSLRWSSHALERRLTHRSIFAARPKQINIQYRPRPDDFTHITCLDFSVTGGPFAGYFIAIWEAWLLLRHLPPPERMEDRPTSPASATMDPYDRFKHNGERNQRHQGYDDEVLAVTLIQYLALLGAEGVFGTNPFRGSRSILQILCDILEDNWHHISRGVRIFSCFVGALGEINAQGSEIWFCEQMAEIASGMSQDQILEITNRFLPVDVVLPGGQAWLMIIMGIGGLGQNGARL